MLRQTLALAICELTDSWEPPLDGEGCIYQRLGLQRRGSRINKVHLKGNTKKCRLTSNGMRKGIETLEILEYI